MYHLTALVTLLAVLLYLITGVRVALARRRFGVVAPATTGQPDFERAFRAQMNTLEWMPVFLPSLWLFAVYVGDVGAAGLGLVWIAGRALYVAGYSRAAEKRRLGFMVQMLAAFALWIGALGALAWRLVM
jgi:glutathione S-transferase